LTQPTCWQRLPPPCAAQYPVSPRAPVVQPSSKHGRLPMSSRPRFAAQYPSTAAIHSRHPPPLSPQRHANPHRTQPTRRWQCESRSGVGFSMSQGGQERLGGTYGGWVVGEDGQGLLLTLQPQVRRLLARRAAFPPLTAGSNTRTRHRCTASTARRRDTFECTCCLRVGCPACGVGELPQLWTKP
jgi:hypothetical protein